MSPITLHHHLNIIQRDRSEIKRFSQRYADRMEEHPNIFMTNPIRNAEIPHSLKRGLPQDLYTWIVILQGIYITRHMLFKTFSHLIATCIVKYV